MKKDKIINKKAMRLWTGLVFVATFILILICSYLLNLNQKKDEELKAVYTTDTTVNRLEAQLNKYLSESNKEKSVLIP